MNSEQIKPENWYGRMLNAWAQIQQLGRNDIELSAGPAIMAKVENGDITPEEGARQMEALLESKQIH